MSRIKKEDNPNHEDLWRLVKNPKKKEKDRRNFVGKIQYVARQVCNIGDNNVTISVDKMLDYILRIVHGQKRLDENRLDEKLTWDKDHLSDKYEYLDALNDFIDTYCNEKLRKRLKHILWGKGRGYHILTYDVGNAHYEYRPYVDNNTLRKISNNVIKDKERYGSDVKAPAGSKKFESHVPLKF